MTRRIVLLAAALSGSLLISQGAAAQEQDVSDEELDDLFDMTEEEARTETETETDTEVETDTEIETDPLPEIEDDLFRLEELTIAITEADVFRRGASVMLLDEEQLQALSYDDPNSLILQVTGAYVRPEDGWGLRPNIGMRGVTSDRSRKITLMEDGILFGPAPYSAPAAYYFPLVQRMTGVEVYKGPASILYGPNTIGGAIDFISREVPRGPAGEIDVSLGRFLSRRVHVHTGTSDDHVGILFDGVHLGSEGFKEIDAGPLNTGFLRTEGVLRGFLQTDPGDALFNRIELKLGYSREESNETYLGLADADFGLNPNRRYASSQLDQMNWWRSQVALTHTLQSGDHIEIRTDLYRNDFQRNWRRLNRFRNGPELLDILSDPQGPRNRAFYEVLTGDRNSPSVDDPAQNEGDLMVIDNDRRFISQGIQTRGRVDFKTGGVAHEIEAGLRLHYDRADRDHQEQGYQMRELQLVLDGNDRIPIDDNFGTSLAFAAHAVYALTFFDVTLTPGIRAEVIHNTFENALNPDPSALRIETDQSIAIPGIGASWQITEELAVLAGAHRGFSPVSPGQPDGVEPETSVNYEVGGRYFDSETGTLGELIGFYNDYDNITGQCGGSTGCPPELIDRQFNGGAANVLGFEAAGTHRFDLGDDIGVPVRVAYTLTHGEFSTSFDSQNPTFGEVEAGDRIPYIPEHQGQLQVGVDRGEQWHVRVSTTYVGAMREEAGGGDPEGLELPLTDDYVSIDVVAGYRVAERVYIYTRLENVLDAQPVAARRPFGARPIRPFMFHVGLRARL